MLILRYVIHLGYDKIDGLGLTETRL